MTTAKEYNSYGEEIKKTLLLRTSPLAVKMLEKESDIPKEAIRPKRDGGYHLAQCQVFALSRRQGATIAMLKEDQWCWAPLIGYGLVEMPDFCTDGDIYYPHFVESREAAKELAKQFPRLEYGSISAFSLHLWKRPVLSLIWCSSIPIPLN